MKTAYVRVFIYFSLDLSGIEEARNIGRGCLKVDTYPIFYHMPNKIIQYLLY